MHILFLITNRAYLRIKGNIMEIKMIALGYGVAIPKVSIGINLISGVYFLLRDTPRAKPFVYGIATAGGLGGKSGTMVFSYIDTAWMKIDYGKHPWLYSKMSLVNKKAQIQIKGTLVIKGKVDITLTIFDKNNETKNSINKIDIECKGGQLSTTSIRGKIVCLSTNANHAYKIDSVTGNVKGR